MLRKFVDEIGIPFCDTMMGKGVIDSRAGPYRPRPALSMAALWSTPPSPRRRPSSAGTANPSLPVTPCAPQRPRRRRARAGNRMYMGTAAISDGDYIHRAIDHADLIILVGHDVRAARPCARGLQAERAQG